MFPQNNQLIQVGIKLNPFRTKIGSNYEITGKIKNCTQTKFNNVKVVLPSTAYNYLSFCHIVALPPYQVVDFRLRVMVKTSNTFSLNENGHIYIKTGSGRLLYTQKYTNQMCCYMDTLTCLKPKPPCQFFNILLLGPAKSGKSMFINSVLTMRQNFGDQSINRQIGPNTDALRRYIIPNSSIAFWDTWDCFQFEKEDFLRILHGWMPVAGWKKEYRFENFQNELMKNKDTCLLRKIHMIIFFFEKENLEDEKKMNHVNQLIRSLPIPPVIILSKADRINNNVRENPLQDKAVFDTIDDYLIKISTALNIPPSRIFTGVNYSLDEEERRSFQIDKNNFIILEHVVKSIVNSQNQQ